MAAAAVFALLLLAQAVPPSDAAVSTAPRMPTTRPAAAAAAMPSIASHSAPPTDDYGYVAWCYGALDSYLSLYDRVMPEVTRIERAFPSPAGADEDVKVYPQMRAQARKDLASYRVAILAAEKANARPIADYGAASLRQGQGVWAATDQMTTVQIAREWMGWSPPAKCDVTAKSLVARSTGPARAANAGSALDAVKALPAEAPDAPAPAQAQAQAQAQADLPAGLPPIGETPAAAPTPAAKPAAAKPAPKPKAPVASKTAATKPPPEPAEPAAVAEATPDAAPAEAPAPKPAPAAKTAAAKAAAKSPVATPALPIGAYVMDPASDKACPGRIDASVRGGRVVMLCVP